MKIFKQKTAVLSADGDLIYKKRVLLSLKSLCRSLIRNSRIDFFKPSETNYLVIYEECAINFLD